MDIETFDKLVAEQLKQCSDILTVKAKEYATPTDRLHNFLVAAEVMDVPPRQALAGMMVKHTVSIYDMCNSQYIYPDAVWDEKITDHINYLILLKGIIQYEKGN
jgi:hypothetical protein